MRTSRHIAYDMCRKYPSLSTYELARKMSALNPATLSFNTSRQAIRRCRGLLKVGDKYISNEFYVPYKTKGKNNEDK